MPGKCRTQTKRAKVKIDHSKRQKGSPAHSKYAQGFVDWLFKLCPGMNANKKHSLVAASKAVQDNTGIRKFCENEEDAVLNITVNDISDSVNLALMTEDSLQLEHMCHATVAGVMTMEVADSYSTKMELAIPDTLKNCLKKMDRVLQTTTPNTRIPNKEIVLVKERMETDPILSADLGLLDEDECVIYEPPCCWTVSNARLSLEQSDLERLKNFLQKKGRSQKKIFNLEQETWVSCTRSPFDVVFSSIQIKNAELSQNATRDETNVMRILQNSVWTSLGVSWCRINHQSILELYDQTTVIYMVTDGSNVDRSQERVIMNHPLTEASRVQIVSDNQSAFLQHASYDCNKFGHRCVVEVIRVDELANAFIGESCDFIKTGMRAWILRVETTRDKKIYMTTTHVGIEI